MRGSFSLSRWTICFSFGLLGGCAAPQPAAVTSASTARPRAALAASAAASGETPFGVCSSAPARVVSIYLIGDSTMSVYGSDRYPRMGWGQPLGELFAEQCAKVDDRAISGRSSKSFSDEGHWAPVRDALQSGDYVLIQFGHNDEKREDPSRFTEPDTTYKQYLTSYVTDTRAHLATPVLLTSIERNQWTGSTLKDSHGPYSVAVRELAHSLHVELIDLTALSKAYFERLGPERTGELFMNLAPGKYPGYPDGSSDNTHLQEGGARLIGLVAMADAYRQKLALARYLKAVPLAP